MRIAPVMDDEATGSALRQAVDALERTGLLLLHDAKRPSLTALVAGAPIRGSWWGHPAGKRIFQVASALEDGGEVLFVPLLSAKVTLIHRRLWPALVSVGEERAPWQMDPLTPAARALLDEVERAGRFRASGPSSKSLARALLVHAEQVHTEGGLARDRARVLARGAAAARGRRTADAPRGPAMLESAASQLGTLSALPWNRTR